jgi:anti-sigma regulatory factor (Ser/Thr protein kinase)
VEDSLVLAANEIFSNIVEHGGANRSGIPVEVSTRGDTIYLQMQYQGDEFDWVGYKEPQVEKMEERGYGMFIIDQLADSVVYCRDQWGNNVVWLAKRMKTLTPS